MDLEAVPRDGAGADFNIPLSIHAVAFDTPLLVADDDVPGIQNSIQDITCVLKEHKSLLQELLQRGSHDLKAAKHLVQHVLPEKPLTRSEMQTLLTPMEQRLRSIESKLQERPCAPMVQTYGDALSSRIDDKYPGSTVGERQSQPDDFIPSVDDQKRDGFENPRDTKSDGADNRDSLPVQPPSSESCDDEVGFRAGRKHTVEIDIVEQHKIKKELQELDRALHLERNEQGGTQSSEIFAVEDHIVQRIEHYVERWNNIEIPSYDNRVYRFANSNCFHHLCMLAILLNSVLVAATVDWQIQHVGQDEPQLLGALQMSFAAFFCAELILRLAAHRIHFFLNDDMLWNIFDLVLVAISCADFIFEHLAGANAGNNVSFMRVLRLLKMARIFRSLRTFQFFKALAVMMASLTRSVLSLFWGMVLLSFVLYLFALIYLQALVDYLNSGDGIDASRLEFITSRFGSLSEAIVSLYMSVTGGEDWAMYYDTMVYVGPMYGLLYLLFTFFFFFGLLNILTGMVVEKAMTEGRKDRNDQVLAQRRRLAQSREELIEVCKSIDLDKDGRITFEEFAQWINHSVMRHLMESLGLDVKDVELFFAAVGARHGDCRGFKKGEVTIERFVEGCLHMKGSATAIDMQKQLYEMDIMIRKFQEFNSAVSQSLSRIEQVITRFVHSQEAP